MSRITFYEPEDENGYLCNFSPHPLKLKGKIFPTSEHYYQSQKFVGTEYEERCRQAETPRQAFEMSRQPGAPVRKDWDDVKDDVMRQAVQAKFTQHPELARLLLETGDAELAEDSPVDDYWGLGKDGNGKNKLGKILMEVREQLKSA